MRIGTFTKGAFVSALLATSVMAIGASAQTAATIAHSYLVFFDFNKADLTPKALDIVDKAAKDALDGKTTQITLTGYTDTVGSDAYNLRLSKRRAMAVQAEMVKQGVPASEIAVYGKGKHDLLVPTGDGVKEPQNRRVSIVFDTAAPPAPPPAQEAAAPAAPAAPPEFTVWAQLEAGITANPQAEAGRVNFGHLFTDKANQPVLNQLLITAEKPLDTSATDYALGYRVQGMFGTDARYTHFLGELDTAISERTQLDVVEAWAYVHTPWLTDGGMDIKVGQFVTYLGAETIDPSGNYLYSKSYIFNFGIPLKHTGFMTITHVNPTLDIYAGMDTGVNTTFDDGDPNTAFAFQGGFGLNGLFDGKVNVLALTHMGPENPVGSVPHANSQFRFLNDVLITYKATDKLTLLTELNYIYDEAYNAEGFGAAEYVKYQLWDDLALVGRAEIWRDVHNFYVAGFRGNMDFIRLEKGLPPIYSGDYITAAGPTTYGEITMGLNYTPAMPAPIQGLTIRPEIRIDGALNSRAPFNGPNQGGGDSADGSQVTFGLDFIMKI